MNPGDADRLELDDFLRIAEYVESETGIHLPEHKREMVQMRVAKRVTKLGFADFGEYVHHVFDTGVGTFERPRLIDAVTTNKTSFFRESDHLEYLTRVVVPSLVAADEHLGRERPLHVWCAACSTGEEPYSVAMLLCDEGLARGQFEFEVRGTDICGDALVTAQRAVYPEEAIIPVPDELRRRYLLRSKDRRLRQVRVGREVRARVRYSRANLLKDPAPFDQPVDVVFCRNVLIYFERETQARVLNRLCRAIRPGGYLFVGHSESLHGFELPIERAAPAVHRRV